MFSFILLYKLEDLEGSDFFLIESLKMFSSIVLSSYVNLKF